MGCYSVGRMGDRTFFMEEPADSITKFQVLDSNLSGESTYYVAEKAIALYVEQLKANPDVPFETIRFRHGGRKWKVIPEEGSKWYSCIWKFFQILFFHKPAEYSPKSFRIERAWFAPDTELTKELKEERRKWKKVIPRSSHLDNYTALIKGSLVGKVLPSEYSKGIRCKVPCSVEGSSHYNDPYTALATLAFQRFEPNFSAKDNLTPLDCKYRIILHENELMLVDAKSPLATPFTINSARIAYLGHMHWIYGEEKMNYIDHLYQLDLKNCKELTPELVFRINCGTTNLEIHDIEAVIRACKDLSLNTTEKNQDSKFISWTIPQFFVTGITRAIGLPNPTRKDFKQWIDKQGDNIDHWISILHPNQEEVNRSFTGRKIINVIQGSYDSGELGEFKPWIDQQELTQTSFELTKAKSFESYLERLSHVVVKKHLARSHPDEGLRVGALIPAYEKDKWYRVTSCCTNQYFYSYTLESASNDPNVPAIELCRNTATSPYALYSSKSIVNDLNLLNPPGYMGINLIDKHREEYYKKRTIPVWVGYLNQAKQTEDSQESLSILIKAMHALEESERYKNRPLSFRDILKKHDVILNELYYRNEGICGFVGKNLSPNFLKIFKELVETYINVERKKIDLASLEEHKKALLAVLQDSLPKEEKRERNLIQALLDDLNGKGVKVNELSELKSKWENATPGEMYQILHDFAVKSGEDIGSKISQSLVFTGQSLGGSKAQIMIARYLTSPGRIPLPDQSCSLVEFDAPGINEEDNEQFMRFGNTHKDLLQALKIRFKIFRRQEVGDVVASVGEEHLGAVFSAQEREESKAWLDFNGALNKRLKTAKQKEIMFATMVHDTLFLEGKGASLELSIEDKKIKTVWIDSKKRYEYDFLEMKYDAHIQGIFDSKGKKNGDFKPSRRRKLYSHLYHKIWKLPRFHVLTEQFRKSIAFIAWIIRKMLLSDRKEDRTFPISAHDKFGSVYVA